MRTWTVRSKGRIERIIIFYSSLSLIIVSILLHAARRSRVDVGSMNSDDIFFFFLTFSPFWIPLLIVTLNKLLRSRIPKEITFSNNQTLIIAYSKLRQDFIPLGQLAYSHSDLSKNHVSLTFYKTFVGSRGQSVYNEVIQVIGMKWTLSWRTDQMIDLINYLTELGVERKLSSNEKLSLFDKISS